MVVDGVCFAASILCYVVKICRSSTFGSTCSLIPRWSDYGRFAEACICIERFVAMQ